MRCILENFSPEKPKQRRDDEAMIFVGKDLLRREALAAEIERQNSIFDKLCTSNSGLELRAREKN